MYPNFTAKTNPFELLRNHATMAALNKAIIPCLTAVYGLYYADWDNVDTATHMIAQVIQSQQLGRYTERTFPAAINARFLQQSMVITFTKWPLPSLFANLYVEMTKLTNEEFEQILEEQLIEYLGDDTSLAKEQKLPPSTIAKIAKPGKSAAAAPGTQDADWLLG
jgi:hypothetical protein